MDALTRLLASAQAREAEGDRAAACAVLDEAPGELKQRALWAYARAALAFRDGQLAQAQAFAEEAVAREPELPEYRCTLAAVLLERFRHEQSPAALDRATRELESALARGPLLPNVRAQLALARLLAHRPAEALALADEALLQDGRHLAALWHRALALEALGRAEESRAAVERLLAVDPHFPPALAPKR